MTQDPRLATAVSLEELLDGAAHGGTVRRRAGWLLRILGVAVLLVVLAAAGWWMAGGRWMIVATPSMGRAAPVGTLVFTEHVTAAQVRVGDIVSFRSPLAPAEIYTHRVVSIDASGALRTRGDINGAQDPAGLGSGDLVGRVVARWWGFGWLIRGLPFLAVTGLVLWFTTSRYLRALWRRPLRVFGSSFLIAVAAYLLKPFVDMVKVASTATANGTDVTLVSTGLLPIRVRASGGNFVDLVDGQVGAVTATGDPGPHGYQFTSSVHLSPGWWIALILIWLTPLAVSLIFGPSEELRPRDDDPAGPGSTSGPASYTSPAVSSTSPAPSIAGTRGAWAAAPAPEPAPAVLRAGSQSRGRHRAKKPTRPRPPGRPAVQRRSGHRRWVTGFSVLAITLGAFIPSTQSAFAAKITNSVDTAASATYFTCASAATATSANGGYFAYPLNETTFTTAADASGNTTLRPGTYTGTATGSFTSSASAPCPRDLPSRAVTVAGGVAGLGNAYVAGSGTAASDPEVFTIEIWFRTNTAGGRLIGFGSAQTGLSTSYDRQIYMSGNGQLNFGVYPNAVKVVTSPVVSTANYADNAWHQVVATLSSAGMALYVDGSLVASDTTTKGAQVGSGFWRVGWDNLNTWPNATTNYNFNGTLAWASVYTTAFTLAQVQSHYRAGIL